MTHANYLASQLARLGITHVFCLMGDTNLDFIGALDTYGIKLIHGRHEQGVVAMADGYARFSGRRLPSVCTVTQGAGLTNATTSAITAMNSGSGVLLVTGDTPANTCEQRFDQAAFCEMISHNAATIADAASAASDFQHVLSALADGAGMGILNIRTQLWNQKIGTTENLEYKNRTQELDITLINKAIELLRQSKRPAILAGRGACYSNAEHAILQLAQKLGAAVITTVPASGFASLSPLYAGTAGTFGRGTGSEALEMSDCILAIGTRMSHWTLDEGIVTHNTPVIRIDSCATAENQRDYLMVQGDARQVLTVINTHLKNIQHTEPWFVKPVTPIQKSSTTMVDPRHFLSKLNTLLPKERLVVLDGGQHVIFTIRELDVMNNTNFAWTSDFGAIGQGIGVAIGAAFARPTERVTFLTGDGGFMMSIAELDTIVRYNLAIDIFVMNDQGFGQERNALISRGFDERLADYTSPDLASLAKAYGVEAHTLTSKEDIENLVINPATGPRLFDIRTDPAIRTDFGKRIAEHRKRARELSISL